MSDTASIDRAGWDRALDSLAGTAARQLVSALGDRGVKRRYLEVRASAGRVTHQAHLAGARAPFRAGLQHLVDEALDPVHRWTLRWILGRWPRGAITVSLPLESALAEFELGILAPLTPTRIALSEGPLPFPAESVVHFRDVHDATEAPGLTGCRLLCYGGGPTALAGRWPVSLDRVPAVAACMGLEPLARELVVPVLRDLAGDTPALTSPVLEVRWSPEPEEGFAVETGPIPTARLLGLVAAALGAEAAEPLRDLARSLKQPQTARARLHFNEAGLQSASALLAPRGQPEAPW